MLDTVVLTLARPWFEIVEPERFSPSANVLLLPHYSVRSRGKFACVLNSTKADRQTGRYWPRLALIRQRISSEWALRSGSSFPRLNSCSATTSMNSNVRFRYILAALHQALTSMGIQLSREALRRAPISAIHYSKNIPLTDYSTCSMAISDLQRIDLTKRLDLSRTDYRNEGHAIRYHANSFEVIFYDKLKDLAQGLYSEKRGLEQDYVVQEEIFRGLASLPKEVQILRMEVRLGTRRKIKSVLRCIGIDTDPTFKALFDASIAKSVLAHFWSPIRAQLPLIGAARSNRPEEILATLGTAGNGKAAPGKISATAWLHGARWLGWSSSCRGRIEPLLQPSLMATLQTRIEDAFLGQSCRLHGVEPSGRSIGPVRTSAVEDLSSLGYRKKRGPRRRLIKKNALHATPRLLFPPPDHLGGGGTTGFRPVAVNGAGRNEPASG